MLFNVYVEQLIEKIKKILIKNEINIRVGRELISFLISTNDCGLLANNKDDL